MVVMVVMVVMVGMVGMVVMVGMVGMVVVAQVVVMMAMAMRCGGRHIHWTRVGIVARRTQVSSSTSLARRR
jgi:hypothetical protein